MGMNPIRDGYVQNVEIWGSQGWILPSQTLKEAGVKDGEELNIPFFCGDGGKLGKTGEDDGGPSDPVLGLQSSWPASWPPRVTEPLPEAVTESTTGFRDLYEEVTSALRGHAALYS